MAAQHYMDVAGSADWHDRLRFAAALRLGLSGDPDGMAVDVLREVCGRDHFDVWRTTTAVEELLEDADSPIVRDRDRGIITCGRLSLRPCAHQLKLNGGAWVTFSDAAAYLQKVGEEMMHLSRADHEKEPTHTRRT